MGWGKRTGVPISSVLAEGASKGVMCKKRVENKMGLSRTARKREKAGGRSSCQLWGAGETWEDYLSPGWVDADRTITMVWVGPVIKEVRTLGKLRIWRLLTSNKNPAQEGDKTSSEDDLQEMDR